MSTTVREEYEVGDLDPAGVLEAAADSRTEPNAEPRSASSSSPPTGPTSTPPPADTGVETFGGAALLADESLGGDGTPLVAAFTPEPFALALGMSPSAGAQLIADALDLRHRLPLLWKRVSSVGGAGLAGPPGRPPDPPPPQGRRDLGRRTARRPRLPAAPSSSTGSSPKPSPPTTPRTTKTARTQSRAGWDVTLTHPEATDFLGTSHLEATGDTLVLKAFYDQVCAIAHQLFLDGDT